MTDFLTSSFHCSVLFLLIEYFFIANKLRNNATNLQIFCEIGNYRYKIEMLRRSFADHIYSYGFSKSSSSVTFPESPLRIKPRNFHKYCVNFPASFLYLCGINAAIYYADTLRTIPSTSGTDTHDLPWKRLTLLGG